MADTSGQESALDTDSGNRPDSARPCVKETCRDGDKPSLSAQSRVAARLVSFWLLIERLCMDGPLDDWQVEFIASDWRAEHRRKRLLMALHARGLVTDEQVERAFAQHPELVGA